VSLATGVEGLALAKPGDIGALDQVGLGLGIDVAGDGIEVRGNGNLGGILIEVVVGKKGNRFDRGALGTLDMVESWDPFLEMVSIELSIS
jgi:hypothetical protein